MRKTQKEGKCNTFNPRIGKEGSEMEKLTITRRDFLKASAVMGATAAVFSPDIGGLKGLTKAARAAAAEAEEKVVHSGCRACHRQCPVLVHVRDGRVVKVEGDPTRKGPSRGRACLRAFGAIQWLYSPTRIKYPLKRVGKRGEGKWQRISWDQAMDEVATKLMEITEKYGAEAITLPGRTGRHDCNMIENRLAYSLNTPNKHWGSGEHCKIIRDDVSACTFGGPKPNADVGKSALRVNWGLERSMSHTTLVQTDVNARWGGGQKVICIDPVFSRTASSSELWLPIRPGTDTALALAWMNVIIGENLYDAVFVKTWTNGPFLASCEETVYKGKARTDLTTGETTNAEIKQGLGELLTEADILEGGSPSRYIFWDEVSGGLKYWDAEEIAWEGGPSGKQHFDAMAEKCGVGQPFLTPATETDISAVSELPPGIDPALLGTYTVTLKDGTTAEFKPVFQHLADIAAEYTPEKTEEITWVPAEKIVAAARMFGSIKPATIDEGVSFDQQTGSSQIIRAGFVLQMLTGNVENPGGIVLGSLYPVTPWSTQSDAQEMLFYDLPMEQRRKALGYYEHAIYCGAALDEDMTKVLPFPYSHGAGSGVMDNGSIVDNHVATVLGKPYPVKAFVSLAVNPLMHDSNVNYLYEGLKKLDHHVAIDIVMTPTCEMADYVFPAVTWFERPWLKSGGTYSVAAYAKSIEPLWEAKHDWEFSEMLAKRMGRGDDWKEGETQEDWYDYRCKRDLGISWQELVDQLDWAPPKPPPPRYKKHELAGKFGTYTGKAEMYSTIFKNWGFPPLPSYEEPGYSPYSQPEMAKEYPLVLTTGKRQPGWFHSEFRMVPWLREIVREPWLLINPDDAAPLGIQDGDWVWIESPVGRCMNKAWHYEGLLPGVVVNSQHAWWRPEKSAEEDMHGAFEWNIGVVCQDEYHNAECASSPLKCQLCKVYPASPEDVEKYMPDITLEQLQQLMPIKEV